MTAAVLASAFHDAATRDLFNRARKARLAQDSSLNSYDSKVRQRLSVYLGIGKLGRDRLVFDRRARRACSGNATPAYESMSLVHASQSRSSASTAREERDAVKEPVTRHEVADPVLPRLGNALDRRPRRPDRGQRRELVNPLAGGAEAYYTYATGDSVSFRLPDGRTIQLREMTVRPRAAKSNLAVGSLWFDIATGQLVRAAYRLAVPAHDDDQRLRTEIPRRRRSPDHAIARRRDLADDRGTLGGRRRVRIVRRTILAAAQPVGRRRCAGADRARSGEESRTRSATPA